MFGKRRSPNTATPRSSIRIRSLILDYRHCFFIEEAAVFNREAVQFVNEAELC